MRQARLACVKCRPYHPEIFAAAFSTKGRYSIFHRRRTESGRPRYLIGKFARRIGKFLSMSVQVRAGAAYRSDGHFIDKNVDLSRLGNRCCPGFPTGNASPGQKRTFCPGWCLVGNTNRDKRSLFFMFFFSQFFFYFNYIFAFQLNLCIGIQCV